MAKGKYKKKRIRKLRSQTNLNTTKLSNRVIKALEAEGIITLLDLDLKTDEELHNISGIGEKAMNEIKTIKMQY